MLKKRWLSIPVAAAVIVFLLAACSAENRNVPQDAATVPTETVSPTESTLPTRTIPGEEENVQAFPTETTEETEHIHDWTKTVIAPTCTGQGYTEYVCYICQESVQDNFVNPVSHSWGSWKTVTEATEEADGKAERSCYFCGKTESRVIPMLSPAHVHTYTETVTSEPTCTKAGIKTFACPCGDRYTDELAQLPHTYVSKTVPATCKLRGYDVFTCTGCGDTYRDNYTNISDDSLS